MLTPSLRTLPPPPKGKSGWPWTKETPPLRKPLAGGRPWPRISIVTPSFNQGAYLEETIRSVLLQGYPNLEYIVFDGGSTDESVAILRKYEPWLAHWATERDRGQAHAVNKGLERATGNIAAYLNSDDYYLSGALQHIARVWCDPGFDVFVGRNKRIGETPWRPSWYLLRRSWWLSRYRPFVRPFILTRSLAQAWSYDIPQECTFWSHDRYRDLRLDESFRFCLDVEWFVRLFAGARIVHSEKVVGVFRLHPESKTAQLQETHRKELGRIFDMYGASMDRVGSPDVDLIMQQFERAKTAALVRRALGRRSPALFRFTHPG